MFSWRGLKHIDILIWRDERRIATEILDFNEMMVHFNHLCDFIRLHTHAEPFQSFTSKIPPNWNILMVFLRAGTKSDLIPPSWNVFFSGVHAAISWSVCVKTWQNMILRPSFSHYNWQKFEKAGRLSALEISSELEPWKSSELERCLRAGTSLF